MTLTRSQCDRSEDDLKQEWLNMLGGTTFLNRCRDGKIGREDLYRFVRQRQWDSGRFNRYLAALLANIEDEGDRFELTHKLFDELGLGDAGSLPHSALYKAMSSWMERNRPNMPLSPCAKKRLESGEP